MVPDRARRDYALDAGEVERRPKVLEPEQAAGPLQAHTLGVNEAGISFLRATRERGDEFGPLSWRHEVAHPLNHGRGRSRRSLIADAVLNYVRADERHITYEQRFVEVDRATLSVERLVAELSGPAPNGRLSPHSGGSGDIASERPPGIGMGLGGLAPCDRPCDRLYLWL